MEAATYPISVNDMPKFSMYNAFREGSSFFPYILADVTDDPRGKSLTELNSYAAVLMYSFAASGEHGKESFGWYFRKLGEGYTYNFGQL